MILNLNSNSFLTLDINIVCPWDKLNTHSYCFCSCTYYKDFQSKRSQQSVHVGLNANKDLLILVFYVFVVGLWENKAGYYDLNSQGRETCHMMTKRNLHITNL